MRSWKLGFLSLLVCLTLTPSLSSAQSNAEAPTPACPAGGDYTLAIHGGAGVILAENMSQELQTAYEQSLTDALIIGRTGLERGQSALDVVVDVITYLENDEKYNAGRGAVFAANGRNELDASIMDGRDRNVGAVSGVTTIKNPIKLARTIMDKSRHVMMQGQGAEDFAREHEIETVHPPYFWTERRWQQLQNRLARKTGEYKHANEVKYGTVGAVVKDACGNLAAGTSTGGLTAKEYGRVGDTPIIGAGTYADNTSCAVSSTGTGEYFIRATVARDICARQSFLDETIQQSSDHLIHTVLPDMGGDGGVIAIDKDGNHAFSFNTEGMYRGVVTQDRLEIGIFGLGQ